MSLAPRVDESSTFPELEGKTLRDDAPSHRVEGFAFAPADGLQVFVLLHLISNLSDNSPSVVSELQLPLHWPCNFKEGTRIDIEGHGRHTRLTEAIHSKL